MELESFLGHKARHDNGIATRARLFHDLQKNLADIVVAAAVAVTTTNRIRQGNAGASWNGKEKFTFGDRLLDKGPIAATQRRRLDIQCWTDGRSFLGLDPFQESIVLFAAAAAAGGGVTVGRRR